MTGLQDISKAPKDGTEFVCYQEIRWQTDLYDLHWDKLKKSWVDRVGFKFNPTYCYPLPTSPEQTK